MSPSIVIALKDLRLLSRDRFALFWALCFPVLFALLFGTIFRGRADGLARIPIAIVEDEPSVASAAFSRALGRSELLTLRSSSSEDAARLVRRGELVAVVRVPRGLGDACELADQSPSIEITFDPTRRSEGMLVRSAVLETATAVRSSTCGASHPVRVISGDLDRGSALPRNGYEVVFPAALLWGLIGCAGSFATAMIVERRSGTFLRLRAAPIGHLGILAGKALAALIASLTVSLALLAVLVLSAGVRVERPLDLAIAIAACAICFVGITMLLSVLGNSEQAVGGAGWALLLLMAMIGGAMVPLAAMPTWLRTASQASPVRWGIVALEGATWRGLGASELALHCGVLVAIGVIAFAVGVIRSAGLDA